MVMMEGFQGAEDKAKMSITLSFIQKKAILWRWRTWLMVNPIKEQSIKASTLKLLTGAQTLEHRQHTQTRNLLNLSKKCFFLLRSQPCRPSPATKNVLGQINVAFLSEHCWSLWAAAHFSPEIWGGFTAWELERLRCVLIVYLKQWLCVFSIKLNLRKRSTSWLPPMSLTLSIHAD